MTHRIRRGALVGTFIVCLLFTRVARAQDYQMDFSLSAGYAMLSADDLAGGDVFDDSSGGYIDLALRFEPEGTENLAVELAFNVAFASEDLDPVFIDPFTIVENVDINLGVANLPEVRALWRVPWGEHFYVEPGVAASFLIVSYDVEGEINFDGFTVYGTADDETGIGVAAGPLLRVGYSEDRFTVGLEAGYLLGWTNVDSDSQLDQGRIGVFVQFRN